MQHPKLDPRPSSKSPAACPCDMSLGRLSRSKAPCTVPIKSRSNIRIGEGAGSERWCRGEVKPQKVLLHPYMKHVYVEDSVKAVPLEEEPDAAPIILDDQFDKGFTQVEEIEEESEEEEESEQTLSAPEDVPPSESFSSMESESEGSVAVVIEQPEVVALDDLIPGVGTAACGQELMYIDRSASKDAYPVYRVEWQVSETCAVLPKFPPAVKELGYTFILETHMIGKYVRVRATRRVPKQREHVALAGFDPHTGRQVDFTAEQKEEMISGVKVRLPGTVTVQLGSILFEWDTEDVDGDVVPQDCEFNIKEVQFLPSRASKTLVLVDLNTELPLPFDVDPAVGRDTLLFVAIAFQANRKKKGKTDYWKGVRDSGELKEVKSMVNDFLIYLDEHGREVIPYEDVS
uniref:Uncharacterized protein n=1 Tax=Chromera velia CCMP2878 TaxID=1169474 RepID=A0A0G4IBC6_9ALVE|eukprot:Cvel_12803.t1-p1 / transcript=Cvel_12803.t1 / gene=Cvel_12803 / organism=Chromera_velia_CCMP2878 / gene_product=hypothetical protein / transcript_product=hypothetical protein / location=Cvel_scaffold853:2673-11613(-) / protein_length=402 / sequence_SO=supercontig / SO=protein_coding / is_pseudo=false